MLQMFIAIEINLEPKENSLDMFQLFLQNLEALKLPGIQYYLTLNNFDDCDDGDGIRYLKSVCKQLPHIDKLVCMKSLLHSHAFCELFRGLKLLIIKDSHIKFTPFAPGDLQQLIITNTIILSKSNSSTGDLKSLKSLVLQDCKTNFKCLITNNYNKSLIETICLIDVEVR